MKVGKAIRKIVALGVGATMMGATILGATAVSDLKDYPNLEKGWSSLFVMKQNFQQECCLC